MHVYFCMKLSSDHQLCVAAAVRIFGDDDLPVDALFELSTRVSPELTGMRG